MKNAKAKGLPHNMKKKKPSHATNVEFKPKKPTGSKLPKVNVGKSKKLKTPKFHAKPLTEMVEALITNNSELAAQHLRTYLDAKARELILGENEMAFDVPAQPEEGEWDQEEAEWDQEDTGDEEDMGDEECECDCPSCKAARGESEDDMESEEGEMEPEDDMESEEGEMEYKEEEEETDLNSMNKENFEYLMNTDGEEIGPDHYRGEGDRGGIAFAYRYGDLYGYSTHTHGDSLNKITRTIERDNPHLPLLKAHNSAVMIHDYLESEMY